MLTDKIRAAHDTIEEALAATPKHPRVMSSFGKDSLVILDMLTQHNVPDALWLTDVDEVVDYEHVAEITKRYNLKVQLISRGRAFFLVHRREPIFFAYTFVNRRHMVTIPTHIIPWDDVAIMPVCIDDELRAPRGYALSCDTDLLFTGFKFLDLITKTCTSIVLPGMDIPASIEGIRVKGAHYEIAPGLPTCAPLFDWTDDEVWQYLREHNVPWSTKVYDEQGRRRPTGVQWCYACHDPNAASLVQCPKTRQMIPNFAAFTQRDDLVVEELRRMGVLNDDRA